MSVCLQSTIAAIATAPGEGGIAIVRISGSEASRILAACFLTPGKQLSAEEIPDRLMRYGHVIGADGSFLDEGMAVLFRAPRSYTREDVAEIHVHGGRICAEQTLTRILSLGARIAEPGEFTRRAFENGRIDLSQAEAVMDAIRADAERAQIAAENQLSGALRNRIRDYQQKLTMLLAKIDAAADYPDEDLEEETRLACVDTFGKLTREIDGLLTHAADARHIREGVITAIFGAPNAGKSSILNLLLGCDRAIVTPIAGTTRDTLEERLSLKGLLFRLIDTAGLRDTEDTVEAIGVSRARQAVEQADILLYVIDASDRASYRTSQTALPVGKPLLILLNKTDLPAELSREELSAQYPEARILSICAKTGEGGDELQEALTETALTHDNASASQLLLGNARHIEVLHGVRTILMRGFESAAAGLPVDLLGIDVQEAWQTLGRITGETCEEDVIDAVFANFCVGK